MTITNLVDPRKGAANTGVDSAEDLIPKVQELITAVNGQHANIVTVADYTGLIDGTTDNWAGINAAIEASQPGDVLVFPNQGVPMRVSQTVDLIEQRTYVFSWSGMWPYRYTEPFPASIKAIDTGGSPWTTGDPIVRILDGTTSERGVDNDGISVIGLVADAGAISGKNCPPISIQGLCRDLYFERCVSVNGKGTSNGFEFISNGTGAPRGIRGRQCVAYSCAAVGFRFQSVTDATIDDFLAVSNGTRGWYVSGSAENNFTSCRSVFNGTDGLFIDGAVNTTTTSQGQTTWVSFATDRNGSCGILFSATGTGHAPHQFIAPRLRRDGSTGTASDAAFKCNSSTQPVDLIDPQVTVGVADDDTGLETPLSAIRATSHSAALSVIGGDLWGKTAAFSTGGSNTGDIRVSAETRMFTGERAAVVSVLNPEIPTTYPPSNSIANVAATATVSATNTFCTTGGSNRTMTVPTPVGRPGCAYRIAKVDTGAGTLIITAAAGNIVGQSLAGTALSAATITGAASKPCAATIVSDGTNWIITALEGAFT